MYYETPIRNIECICCYEVNKKGNKPTNPEKKNKDSVVIILSFLSYANICDKYYMLALMGETFCFLFVESYC